MQKLLESPKFAYSDADPRAFAFHLLNSLHTSGEYVSKAAPFVETAAHYLDLASEEDLTKEEKSVQNARKAAQKLRTALEEYLETSKDACAALERNLST